MDATKIIMKFQKNLILQSKLKTNPLIGFFGDLKYRDFRKYRKQLFILFHFVSVWDIHVIYTLSHPCQIQRQLKRGLDINT